ncbi:MAG: hypothetical protein IPI69_14720 [Bacteroidales bacterium]|nr:hypothetical protein [Bacteroidales bacterium]
MGRSPNELVSRELPRGGILTATLPGVELVLLSFTPGETGLLEDQPSRLVDLMGIIITWQKKRHAASGSGSMYFKFKASG